MSSPCLSFTVDTNGWIWFWFLGELLQELYISLEVWRNPVGGSHILWFLKVCADLVFRTLVQEEHITLHAFHVLTWQSLVSCFYTLSSFINVRLFLQSYLRLCLYVPLCYSDWKTSKWVLLAGILGSCGSSNNIMHDSIFFPLIIPKLVSTWKEIAVDLNRKVSCFWWLPEHSWNAITVTTTRLQYLSRCGICNYCFLGGMDICNC